MARSKQKPSFSLILLEFLGSMNLAIMLLCAVAIASAIGTLLQQNQPYEDYLLRFGPFWFEVFEQLGLYNLYAAPWFQFTTFFLVLSTSVCVYRNSPAMLREMRHWQDEMQRRALLGIKHRQEYDSTQSLESSRDLAVRLLQAKGYQVRGKAKEEAVLLAAKRGMFNRLGYILTHVGIVVIALGFALDSMNFRLSLLEKFGDLVPETRNIPASEVPARSWLSEDTGAFRGNVNLPEGQRADLVFLNMRDGYLVQRLPFEIELKDFRIEHYKTGQPKSFESDLVIHDELLDAPLETTIAVNHPLIYRGHAIYQASFQDGGSRLQLQSMPLFGNSDDAGSIEAEVFEQKRVHYAGQNYTLEFDDFRLFNINPVLDENGDSDFKNFGPNFTFKLRNQDGQAREYVNYMAPIEFGGRRYFTSGVRNSVAEPFRYLHIPVDANYSMDGFFHFLELLRNSERMRTIAEATVAASLSEEEKREGMGEPLVNSMLLLSSQYVFGGYQAIINDLERRVPEERREEVFEAYVKVLRTVLGAAFAHTLEGEPTEQDWAFFNDAAEAINAISAYGSPVYLQLKSFEHVQASGLQITKSPGKFWVYLGCAMLTAGVFMLFYITRRRLWLWLEPTEQGTRVLLAGQSHRKTGDFEREFQQLGEQLNKLLQSE